MMFAKTSLLFCFCIRLFVTNYVCVVPYGVTVVCEIRVRIGPLTYEECKTILETFHNDKAPRETGFNVEFYTYFFDLLGNDLIASFNEAHEKGELSISQRRGLITLIPKEDGSLLDISKWSNVDLKIASKTVAKRTEPTLSNLIHSDQTAFVKGRFIGENIRLISDIMDYTSLQSLPGILTSVP